MHIGLRPEWPHTPYPNFLRLKPSPMRPRATRKIWRQSPYPFPALSEHTRHIYIYLYNIDIGHCERCLSTEHAMCHATVNARQDVRSPTAMNDVACRVSTPDFRPSARCCSPGMETNSARFLSICCSHSKLG